MRSVVVACLLVGSIVAARAAPVELAAAAGEEKLPLGVFRFRHFGAAEGLRNFVVWSLAQDDAGIIWVGTDDGAYRYDGVRFTHYSVADGLQASAVTALGVAPDGQVCAGGAHGLACWDPAARQFSLAGTDGLPRTAIRVIARRLDQLWVGTDRGVYVRSGAGSFAPAPGWPGGDGVAVFALWADARGVVAAFKDQVAVGDGNGGWQIAGGDVASGSEPIDGVTRDKDGVIWLRTAVKLYAWSPASHTVRDLSEGLPTSRDSAGRATAILASDGGDIWVGTDRGPAVLRDGQWRVASSERGLAAATVRALLIDHERSAWVGGNGLWQWTGRTLTERHDETSGLPGTITWTIGRDHRGRLYAGTDRCLARGIAGAWRCEPGTNERIVRAVVAMPDGGMFIGGAPGDLLYLDPAGRATSIQPAPFLPEDHILTLALYDGDLWVGTRTRLLRLRGARPGPLEPVELPGVGGKTRLSHLLAVDGVLWATTERGLALLEAGRWRVFDTRDGLRSAAVRYVLRRGDGRICVSYTEAIGLSCFRRAGELRELEHIGEAEGLAAGMVYFLAEDRDGRLWVGTGNGVDVIAHGADGVDHFDDTDGLAGNDCAAKAFYLDRDGALWMGASGGLSHVEAQHYRGAPPRPRVRMIDGKLGGRVIEHGRLDRLVAGHDANALWVSYAVGSYLDPDRLIVQTRLWPVESEWSTSSTAEVRTPALPAGSYRLEARARIGGGAWGPVDDLVFAVEPAWWQRAWAMALLATAAIALVAAAITWRVRRRTRQLIAQADELERRVQARTGELDERNRRMRRLLDNVGQGFITIDLHGAIDPERSAIVVQWLGPLPAGEKLADVIMQRSPESEGFATWLEIGLDSLRDGTLPYELAVEQLQTRFTVEQRSFDVAYSPIYVAGEVQRLLLIVSDITAQVARERSERKERDLFAIFKRIHSDRTGFDELVHDASELVDGLARADDATAQRRIVHTLKGNCSLFGLDGYAELCHRVEDELAAQEPEPLSPSQRDRLVVSWFELIDKVRTMLGGDDRSIVEVERGELALALARAQASGGRELALQLASWAHEPVARRFERLARHGVQLARQLGKGALEVEIRDGGLRLDTARWAAFWAALVHVVRNAVDHGIEPPAQRRQAGKPEHGTLTLTASADDGRVRISISDDGGGIDWERLRQHAEHAGVPTATRTDLEDALFLDGISTRNQVTATSGRGVGLASLRQEVRSLGGTIAIETAPGAGTTLTFEFPAEAASVTTEQAAASHDQTAA